MVPNNYTLGVSISKLQVVVTTPLGRRVTKKQTNKQNKKKKKKHKKKKKNRLRKTRVNQLQILRFYVRMNYFEVHLMVSLTWVVDSKALRMSIKATVSFC